MRIRRFEAPDHKTALAMVKDELGDDAVILANRTIRSPAGRSRVEVVAALDRDIFSMAAPAAEKEVRETMDRPADNRRFQRNLAARMIGYGVEPPAKNAEPPEQGMASPTPAGRPRPDQVARWRDRLIADITYNPLSLDQRRVVAMVGATGVGKTTTAAKLAAWASLHENRSVALISMDCYRIGATDQLRTYARIMQIPCEVVLRPAELKRALARHSGRDLVIIDTSGKNPYDEQHVGELLQWFSVSNRIEPLLAVSATTKKEDLAAVIDAYQPLGIRGLALTKLDETRAYAALCQQVVSSGLPVSCLATGQKVPEDFLLASPETVGKLFREGWPQFIS